MIETFKEWLVSNDSVEFITAMVDGFFAEEAPFMSYLSVEVCHGEIASLKLYAHTYIKMPPELVRTVFPNYDLIKEKYGSFSLEVYNKGRSFYADRHPLDDMGIAFKLTIKDGREGGRTFYLRDPALEVASPRLITLRIPEGQFLPPYYSFEVKNGKVLGKSYYLFSEEENRKQLLDFVGLRGIDTRDISYLEYLEQEDRGKVSVVIPPKKINVFVANQSDVGLKILHSYIVKDIGLIPVSIGKDSHSKYSFYYASHDPDRSFYKDSYTFMHLLNAIKSGLP